MAQTAPTGKVYLLSGVPLSNSYAHSIHFGNLAEQLSYFTGQSNGELTPNANNEPVQVNHGKVDKVLSEQNYIKKETGIIRVALQDENVHNCNYMMWKCPVVGSNAPSANYTWFFAFITEVVYVSNAVTELHYEVDVLQTYAVQSNWNDAVSFKECLIERVTPSSDTIGEHLEPEPIGFSEYKVEKLSSLIVDTSWKWVVFAPFDVTNPPDPSDESYRVVMNGMAGGVLQGVWSYAYTSYNDMEHDIENMDSRLAEKIIAIVAIPAGFIGSGLLGAIQPNIKDVSCTRPASIDGYTPNYNKLWTDPFNSIILSNTHGSSRQLRFEYFQDPQNITFHLVLGISPNPEMLCCPNFYGHGFVEGNKPNYLESVSITDFPHTAWTGNGYTAWLETVGAKNIANTVGTISGSIVAGVLNPATIPASLMNIGGSIAGNIIDQRNAGVTRTKSYGNTGGSLCLMADGAVNFYVYQQCVNSNDARRIDDYFSRFGYATGEIQTPGTATANRNQHYIKTTGCMVVGGCNAEHLRKIEQIFNNGVTWWNKDHIGEYN